MKVLITGGAGYIGSTVASACEDAGHQVVILDDFSTGSMANLTHALDNPRFRLVEGSVLDRQLVHNAIAEVVAYSISPRRSVSGGSSMTR